MKRKYLIRIVIGLAFFALSAFVSEAYAQGFGIDVSSPNAKLDVNGDIALRMGSVSVSSGANNNINIGSKSFIRLSGATSNYHITGIQSGVEGKMLILFNSTTHDLTIYHQSNSSSASNRILCADNANAVIKPYGCATFIYSAIDSRWILVSVWKS